MLQRKHIRFLLTLLILGSVLITGCTNRTTSDDVSQLGQEVTEETITEKGISVQTELTFQLGQKINVPDSFTGTVYMVSMINHDDVYNFPQTNHITFEPGARSNWHTHGGMILLVTGGVGYYQEEGKPAQIIRKGDVVECPAGVLHWHGAASDSWFSQIVIYDSQYRDSGESREGEPLFLQEFVENLTLTMDGAEHYAYAAATCGVSYGNFGSEAVRAAKKAGIHLDATFRIRMVDNWNPYFDMTDKEYIDAAERRAEEDLAEVCASVAAKEKGIYLPDSFEHKQEEELAASYEESRKTQLFKVNENCVGCGVCAGQCPVGAIEVQNKKPVWIKEKCLLCLGCVHKCPMNAIAYTEETIGHGQYTNPHISEII